MMERSTARNSAAAKSRFTGVERLTRWVGSPASLAIHTAAFAASFASIGFGADSNMVLLILTTAVSLEAIYLAIFIQMTVNRNTESLAEVEEDIDEIQEDVDEIQEDIDEIQEDVDEIQEDVGDDAQTTLADMQVTLRKLLADVERMRK